MKFLIVTLFIGFGANHAMANGLNAAFEAALANSEQDHKNQQVAFQVEPDQVEKATFRKYAPTEKLKPEISGLAMDVPTALKEIDVDSEEVQDEKSPYRDEELALMGKEIDDFE